MYFHESEAIAREHPDLQAVVEQIDGHLATIFSAAPLRPGDFSCILGCDTNQVVSIFDLLARREVLLSDSMVECDHCYNLMSALVYDQTIADEDEFLCSSCNQPFRQLAPRKSIYRMTAETLARPKPATANPDIEVALGELGRSLFVFRRLGQIWVLKFEGEMKLMHDARGLFYIARILSEKEHDIPAASLLAAVVGIDPRVTTGSSGHLLDDKSLATYRRRYHELQQEIHDARSNCDLGRVARLETEMEAFGTEIARATGLSGRKRERTDAEKIRKSVSMAVSRAIDAIQGEHPVLGKHLLAFITSGTTFRYDPDRDIDWLT